MAFVGVGLGSVSRSLLLPRASRVCARPLATMSLVPGATLPLEKELMVMEGGKPTSVKLSDVFAGKKVVVFTIPGALTPTCTDNHAPEYAKALPDLKAKGVDGALHMRASRSHCHSLTRSFTRAQMSSASL